jgi:hypothetical protein
MPEGSFTFWPFISKVRDPHYNLDRRLSGREEMENTNILLQLLGRQPHTMLTNIPDFLKI